MEPWHGYPPLSLLLNPDPFLSEKLSYITAPSVLHSHSDTHLPQRLSFTAPLCSIALPTQHGPGQRAVHAGPVLLLRRLHGLPGMAAFSAPEPRAVPPPPARRRPRRPPAGVEAAADAAGAGEQELHLQPQGQGGAHDHIRLRRRQLRQELRRRPPALLRLRRSRQAS